MSLSLPSPTCYSLVTVICALHHVKSASLVYFGITSQKEVWDGFPLSTRGGPEKGLPLRGHVQFIFSFPKCVFISVNDLQKFKKNYNCYVYTAWRKNHPLVFSCITRHLKCENNLFIKYSLLAAILSGH